MTEGIGSSWEVSVLLAAYADAIRTCHAIFPRGERLHDKPKEHLRRMQASIFYDQNI